MLQEEINDLLLVGKFMNVEHIFPYNKSTSGNIPGKVIGVYIAEDVDGTIDWDNGIHFYDPDTNWNTLIDICKKIITITPGKKEKIFESLQKLDIKITYKVCLDIIKCID